jgi:hypothetical protein
MISSIKQSSLHSFVLSKLCCEITVMRNILKLKRIVLRHTGSCSMYFYPSTDNLGHPALNALKWTLSTLFPKRAVKSMISVFAVFSF